MRFSEKKKEVERLEGRIQEVIGYKALSSYRSGDRGNVQSHKEDGSVMRTIAAQLTLDEIIQLYEGVLIGINMTNKILLGGDK